jgi:hypothetical protein
MSIKTIQAIGANRFLCSILLFLAIRCLDTSAYHAAAAPGGLFSIDFAPAYSAAARLNAGRDLYIPEERSATPLYQFVSSPLLPVLLRPLARHPLDAATRMWAAINVVLLTLAVILCAWAARIRPLEQPVPALVMLFTAFRYWPTTVELGIGNSDIVILFLASAMFVCSRFHRWFLFAFLVAIAALTKSWMIGAIFYLLVRRQWAAAAAGVGFFAGIGALLFGCVGWRELPVMLQLTHLYSTQLNIVSSSVAGFALLYFRQSHIISPLVNSAALWAAVLIAGYGFLVVGLASIWLRAPRMNEWELNVSLAMTFLALILGSPVSHQYYYVLALPLFWLLLYQPDGSRGLALPAIAFVLYMALTIPSPALNPVGPQYQSGIRSLAVGVTFLSGMALWACGLFAVMRGLPSSSMASVAGAPGRNASSPDYAASISGLDTGELPVRE